MNLCLIGEKMGTKYSAELKAEIIAKVKSGRIVSSVAEEHGIKSKAVYDMIRGETQGKDSAALEISKLKREKEVLLKLIGQMTYESATLKKRLN